MHHGERHSKGRPAAECTLDCQCAAMRCHNLLHNVEAKPTPPRLGSTGARKSSRVARSGCHARYPGPGAGHVVRWPASVSVPPCGMASKAFCTRLSMARRSVLACKATVPRSSSSSSRSRTPWLVASCCHLRGPRVECCPEVLRRPLELRRAHKRQVILHQILQARQVHTNLGEHLGHLGRAPAWAAGVPPTGPHGETGAANGLRISCETPAARRPSRAKCWARWVSRSRRWRSAISR